MALGFSTRSLPVRAFASPVAFGISLGMALGIVTLSAPAFAQDADGGFSLEQFDRPEPGSRFFASDTLELRDPWKPAFGLLTDYSFRPFSIVDANGNRSSLVRNVWSVDADASIVIAGGLRLGLSVPLTMYQDGHSALIGTSYFAPPTGPAFGDIRIAGDVFVYGEKRDSPVSITVGVAVFLPTGQRISYTGDEEARVYPRVLLTGKYRDFRYGMRAGYMVRQLDSFFGAVEIGSEVLVGASVGYERGPLVVGPEFMASTVTSSAGGPFTKETTPAEILLGAHYALTKTFVLGAGVGTHLNDALGAPLFRALMSIEYVPLPNKVVSDRDHDGVPDDLDECPDEPGCDELHKGCPSPAIDTNGDGIPDYTPTCFSLPSKAQKSQAPNPPTKQPDLPRAPPPASTLDPCERVDAPFDCTQPIEPPKDREAPLLPPTRTWGG